MLKLEDSTVIISLCLDHIRTVLESLHCGVCVELNWSIEIDIL